MKYIITNENYMANGVYFKNIGWRQWKMPSKGEKYAYVIIKGKKVYANQVIR